MINQCDEGAGMSILVHGRARIRSDKLEAVRTAAIHMSKASQTEPGCRRYQFSQDLADPTVLVLTEEWTSEEALRTHLASPAFAEFAELFGQAVDGAPQFVRFNAADERPLFGATT
jgi:quinol monooxygenase YgiN